MMLERMNEKKLVLQRDTKGEKKSRVRGAGMGFLKRVCGMRRERNIMEEEKDKNCVELRLRRERMRG